MAQSDAIGVTFTRPIFFLVHATPRSVQWQSWEKFVKRMRVHIVPSLELDLMAHPGIPHPSRGNIRDNVPVPVVFPHFQSSGPRIRAAVRHAEDFPNLT